MRGRVTAVLPGDHHPEFWNALGLDDLAAGSRKHLNTKALSEAWAAMPITPTDLGITDEEGLPRRPATPDLGNQRLTTVETMRSDLDRQH